MHSLEGAWKKRLQHSQPCNWYDGRSDMWSHTHPATASSDLIHIYSYEAVSGLGGKYSGAQVRQQLQSCSLSSVTHYVASITVSPTPLHRNFVMFSIHVLLWDIDYDMILIWLLIMVKRSFSFYKMIFVRPLRTIISLIPPCLRLMFYINFSWKQTLNSGFRQRLADQIHCFVLTYLHISTDCNKHTGKQQGAAERSVLRLLWILGQRKKTKQTYHHYVTKLPAHFRIPLEPVLVSVSVTDRRRHLATGKKTKKQTLQ